jgi:hypothetical protein
MNEFRLLAPPAAFVIMLTASVLLSWGLSRLSVRVRRGEKGLEPYACGEEIPSHMIQPDYGQFLPFAIFFTLLHVTALVVATVPAVTLSTLFMAVVYLLGAVVGLTVLYRR